MYITPGKPYIVKASYETQVKSSNSREGEDKADPISSEMGRTVLGHRGVVGLLNDTASDLENNK